jgi:hypothetical protein
MKTGLNALDRIVAYYQPTSNMPGRNLNTLVKGITYQENTYRGNAFSPEDAYDIDIELRDQTFYPNDIQLVAIAFNGISRYVAIGNSDQHAYYLISDDGVNWESNKMSENAVNVTDISYSGSYFIASSTTSDSPTYISTDGTDWVSVSGRSGFSNKSYDEYAYDNLSMVIDKCSLYSTAASDGRYVAVGDKVIVSSADGMVWNTVYTFNTPFTRLLKSVIYTNLPGSFTGFIAVGASQDLAYTAAHLVFSSSVSPLVMVSVDGVSWNRVYPAIIGTALYGIASSSSLIVAVGNSGKACTSVNGSNWTPVDTGAVVDLLDVIYAQEQYVTVGNDGTILTSTDGTTWVEQTSGVSSDLTAIIYDGTRFVVVGSNSVILTSSDAVEWTTLSIGVADTLYNIQGSTFMSGYGPEELVSGVISDNLNMYVRTRPSANWDFEVYGHTGFMMRSTRTKLALTVNVASFANLVDIPAAIAVYVINDNTNIGIRIYEDTLTTNIPYTYSVNWITKEITIDTSLDDDESLLIEAYEVGGSNQLFKDNTDNLPLRIDAVTGFSELRLGYKYNSIVYSNPVCYCNGVKLVYPVDYIITTDSIGLTKIIFDTTYDPDSTYITFTVFGPTGETQYGYSIPEVQLFTGDGLTDTFTLDNFSGDANIENSIVELNGVRLRYGVDPVFHDYTLDSGILTLAVIPNDGDILAVTTYNDTSQQSLITDTTDILRVNPIYYVDNSTRPVSIIIASYDPGFVDGDQVIIDGVRGSKQLNGNSYYIKVSDIYAEEGVDYFTYRLYTDLALTLGVDPNLISNYSSPGGYVWLSSQVFTISQGYAMTDATRLFITVNGLRVNPEQARFYVGNNLNILTTIAPDDIVQVTSMVPTATPNEIVYTMNVDKNGTSNVYRANSGTATWLTADLLSTDDIIHVRDVSTLISELHIPGIVTTLNDLLQVRVQCVIETVKEVVVYNVTSLTTLDKDSYALTNINAIPTISFSKQVNDGDEVQITLRLGNVVLIDSERISFKVVDYQNNTVSQLIRGVQGTGEVTIHTTYAVVNSLVPTNELSTLYYNKTWNSTTYSVETGDPLQLSNTDAANFLKYGSI